MVNMLTLKCLSGIWIYEYDIQFFPLLIEGSFDDAVPVRIDIVPSPIAADDGDVMLELFEGR